MYSCYNKSSSRRINILHIQEGREMKKKKWYRIPALFSSAVILFTQAALPAGAEWSNYYDDYYYDTYDKDDGESPYVLMLQEEHGIDWEIYYNEDLDPYNPKYLYSPYVRALYTLYETEWLDFYDPASDPYSAENSGNGYIISLFEEYGIYWQKYYDSTKDPYSDDYSPVEDDPYQKGYYDQSGYYYPYSTNEGIFNPDGSYDPDDPYMILQKMYDEGELTPYTAQVLYFEKYSETVYNPFFDRNNPAYYKAGPDITWEVKNHVLTLTGTGSMYETPYMSNLLNWKRFRDVVAEIHFDDRITDISSYAFNDFTMIESLELPSSLKTIGEYCFGECFQPQDVEFPDTLESIGSSAFMGCGFQSVSLPKSLKKLGYNAFSNNMSLVSVSMPDSLQFIGSFCFAYCFMLEDAVVPKSVEYIGNSVFEQDVRWYKNQPDDFIVIGDGFLYGYTGHDAVLTIPEGVKCICPNALTELEMERDFFGEYTSIYEVPNSFVTKVILPKSLEELRNNALSGMYALEEVVFQGNKVKTIEHGTFQNDPYLYKIILPDSIEIIEDSAFEDCVSLSEIEIPSGVQKIGINAFAETPFLKNQPDYVILGDGILYKYNGYEKCLNIPEGVKRISSHALFGKEVLTVTMPDSLRVIEENGIQGYYFVEINLNEGLEVLEPEALSIGRNLESLYIPASLEVFSATSVYNHHVKTIYGNNKTAKAFARLYGLDYLSEKPGYTSPGPDMTLDIAKDCWSFGNFSDVFDGHYYFNDHDREVIEELPCRESLLNKTSWTGACFGMTATIILMKAGIYSPSQLKPGAKTVSELLPDENVQSFINFYHNVQYLTSFSTSGTTESGALRMYRIINAAKHVKDGELPFMISFSATDFGHAVVGYGQEDGEWTFEGEEYDGRILVWDPNYPNVFHSTSCIYYNSKTFNYCIPHYNVYYRFDKFTANSGSILYMCNDISRLDPRHYEFVNSGIITPSKGDLNGDRLVDVSDAVMLARYIAEDSTLKMPTASLNYTDVNADGIVDPKDVISILRIIAKLDAA